MDVRAIRAIEPVWPGLPVQILYVPLSGLIDIDNERTKLSRERAKVEKSLNQVNGKLGNEKFLSNAPPAVVDKEKAKKAELDNRLSRIAEAEERLKALSKA